MAALDEAALAQLLVARGMVTPEQLQALFMRRQAGDPRGLPELLQESGLVHPAELGRLLQGSARLRHSVPETASDPGLRSQSQSGSRRMRGSGRGGPIREGESVQLRPELDVRVERMIGEGGMGSVFLVRDQSLGRPAALKLMKPGGSPLRAVRFKREAAVTARLDHPGIPPVYATGATPMGQEYLLMRYVAGKSLAELLSWGKEDSAHTAMDEAPDRRTLLDALVKVGEALAYAHYRGIVHRDVKPANIMVGAFGEVLLMDWGLARDLAETHAQDEQVRFELVEAVASTRKHLTQDGAVLGTPGYMSPEQARGEDLDARADVFALGSLLVEVLTGDAAVTGGTTLEVIGKTSAGKIDLPSSRDHRVPPELDAIAARALAVDPAERYSTAERFALDLKAWLEGRPVSVYRYSRREQLARFLRAHPALVASALAVFLVGAIGLAAVSRARAAERADAVRRDREASGEAWAALERAGEAEADARLGLALAALQAAQRWRIQAPTDPEAAKAEFRAAMALGDVSQGAEQWALAAQAFSQAALLGVDDAQARAASVRAEEARTGEGRRRREAVLDLLRRAREGALSDKGGAFQEAVYQLVGYADAPTLALVVEQLDGVTAELARSQEQALLDAARPDADEARAGERPIEGLAAALEERTRAGLGKTIGAEAEARITAAEERIERRLRRDSARARTVLQYVAGKQREDLGQGRLLAARLCCEALGRLGRLDPLAAEAALGRYLAAEADGLRAVPAGLALCRLGGARAQRLLLGARERFHDEHFRDQIDQVLGQMHRDQDLPLEEESAREYLRRGQVRMTQRRFADAAADFSRAIDLEPEKSRGWVNRGSARMELDDAQGALADHTKAIELEPEKAGLWANRASAHQKLGNRAAALADYEEALRLDPRDGRILSNRGLYLREIGEDQAALRDFDASIELDATNHISLMNRSQLRAKLKDLAGARADADRALELAPDDGRFWAARALVKDEQGDKRGALEDLNRAVELAPRELVGLANRGNVLLDLGDAKGALNDFLKAAEVAPKEELLWRSVARAHLALGAPEKALEAVDHALELAPRVPEGWTTRGEALLRMNDRQGALAAYDRAITVGPRKLSAWRARARLKLELGDGRGALADVEELARLAPNDSALPALRALAASLSGDGKGALASLDRDLEKNPDDGELLRRRGQVRGMNGDAAGAEQDLTRAIELGVSDTDVYTDRGVARAQLRRLNEARDDFDHALQLDPRNVRAWQGLAQVHFGREDGKAALAAAERVIELDPNAEGAYINRAISHELLGNLAAAAADAERGLERAPDEPLAWFCRGRIRVRQRDHAGALADLDKALALDPSNPEVERFRAQALEGLGRFADAARALEAYLRTGADPQGKLKKRLESLRERAN